jgi:uncharacterized protein (DUF58 family)
MALPDPLRDAALRVRRAAARTGAGAARMAARTAAILGPLAALVGRVLGPRLAIVAPAGWIAALLALVAFGVGYGFGWQELTYVGFTILIGLLACVAFLIGRSTYEVRIELSPPRVVVGERALGRLGIRNNGTRAVLPARMELPVGTGLATFAIPGLKPGADHEELFAVPTHRRAVIVAGPAISVRGDALGLLRRTVRWTEPVDLFVHPLTVPLTPSAAGLVRDLEGQVTKKITNNDLSFHALRGYEPGDDRRYVHWRTSARTGQLMVRQFEETRRSQLTIVLSESGSYYSSPEEFELAVSVAASIAVQVIRDGTAINVVSESRRLHTHSPTALLDDSCRLEPIGRRYPDARAFVRDVTRRLPAPSVLILVAGAAMTTADYRMVELLFPGDTTMLAVRVAEGESPSIKPVGGMLVLTIGALSDLPKVLRRTGIG